jgi:hypothetical protein
VEVGKGNEKQQELTHWRATAADAAAAGGGPAAAAAAGTLGSREAAGGKTGGRDGERVIKSR